jgi:hypothetical protein
MPNTRSRLPLACSDETLTARTHDETQLEFSFAGQKFEDAPSHPIPARSCQKIRSRSLGRRLHASGVERSLEEIQLEHGVACHVPPGKVLDLRLTENTYTIVSVRRGRECYRVRVHRMFAGVEPRLVRALARYVVHNDQRASTQLSQFIEEHQDSICQQPRRARRVVLRTQGRVHDLGSMYDRLNRRYFDGKLSLRITWGAARKCHGQRSVKVGAYLVEDRLIRVHPVLDQELVPRFFLEWIVFHEMLHAKHAIRRVGGRLCYHPPEFAQEEQRFADYARARLWEKSNLDRLIG